MVYGLYVWCILGWLVVLMFIWFMDDVGVEEFVVCSVILWLKW